MLIDMVEPVDFFLIIDASGDIVKIATTHIIANVYVADAPSPRGVWNKDRVGNLLSTKNIYHNKTAVEHDTWHIFHFVHFFSYSC